MSESTTIVVLKECLPAYWEYEPGKWIPFKMLGTGMPILITGQAVSRLHQAKLSGDSVELVEATFSGAGGRGFVPYRKIKALLL